MTTRANKPVSRLTTASIRDGGKRREIVVIIYPNGLLGLRPKGTRREEQVLIEAVWYRAVKDRVASEQAAKRALRGTRRERKGAR